MRVDVLRKDRLRNAGSVAVLVLSALVAGCSSDVARFDDGFYTGAIPKQPIGQVAMAQPTQAYPGNLDSTATGSIARGPMPGYGANPGAGVQSSMGSGGYGQSIPTRTASVERNQLPAPTPYPSASQQPVYQPPAQPTYQPAPALAAPAAQQAAARPSGKAGWQNTGNMVTLRQGETIDALSSRYGVPAKAILAANGLSSASETQPGQQISIPSYSYGQSPTAARTAAAAPTQAQALGTPPGPLRVPSAKPAASATSAGNASVVVTSGDSLMGIARRTGVSVADLRAANGITGDNIRIGQTLALPNGASAPTARVAALDTMTTGSVAAPKPAAPATPKAYEAPRAPSAAPAATPAKEQVAAAPAKPAAPKSSVTAESGNDVATAAPEGTGISQFRWPVQGRVVKRFGEKAGSRRNDGVDISVPAGTSVKAAENGVVIYAGDGLKEFGNTVLVKHDNGLVTVYGHADQLKVKRGATVRRGQEIATAGTSGDTDAPKVHFEVRKNSAPVDPMTFLQ